MVRVVPLSAGKEHETGENYFNYENCEAMDRLSADTAGRVDPIC